MDFSDWKIENDIYLYFWIVYFKPILNYDNTYELFIEKNSSWADLSEYKDVIEDNKKYIKITSPQSSPIRRGSIRNLLKNFPFIPSPIRITETGVLARLSSKLERSRGLG
ncbi:MAG: hypothetical protein Q8S84_03310 [bacterium]|nr:hypothetical protein [bacterium]